MKLSSEQAGSVIEYVSRVSGNNPIVCPVCGNNQWSLNDLVTEMREFCNGKLPIGTGIQIIPFVSITCNRCGHSLFFNAIRAGVVTPQPAQEQQKQADNETQRKS